MFFLFRIKRKRREVFYISVGKGWKKEGKKGLSLSERGGEEKKTTNSEEQNFGKGGEGGGREKRQILLLN